MDKLKRFVLNRIESRVSKEDTCFLFTGDIGSILLISLLEGMIREIIVPCFELPCQETNRKVRKIAKALDYPEIEFGEVVIDSGEIDKEMALALVLLESTEKYMMKKGLKTLITSISKKGYQPIEGRVTVLSPLEGIPEPEMWRYIKTHNNDLLSIDFNILNDSQSSTKAERSEDEEVLKRLKSLGYL